MPVQNYVPIIMEVSTRTDIPGVEIISLLGWIRRVGLVVPSNGEGSVQGSSSSSSQTLSVASGEASVLDSGNATSTNINPSTGQHSASDAASGSRSGQVSSEGQESGVQSSNAEESHLD